jgi:bifunctional polynucleotide phosphatase/kinase
MRSAFRVLQPCLHQVLPRSAKPPTRPFHHRPSNASSRAAPPVSPRPRSVLETPRPAADRPAENAVANFFTPASQKPKERTVWSERGPNEDTPATLLVGRYEPEGAEDKSSTRRVKVAAFDLDSTLITTSSGKKHAGSATDWKWWEPRVPGRLRELYEEGYRVVILSNQAGLTLHTDPKSKAPKAGLAKRVTEFKQKCNAVLNNLDLPVTIYAATGKDIYRKPRTGMWKELCDDYDIPEAEVDLANSIFVGDAGGRIAGLAKGQDRAAAPTGTLPTTLGSPSRRPRSTSWRRSRETFSGNSTLPSSHIRSRGPSLMP